MADYGNYTTYHFDDVDEMSDYESTGAPPPPPPDHEYGAKNKRAVDGVPRDLENNTGAASNQSSEYDKLNQTMATSPDYDDEVPEDGSVEIPPTKVVEDMVRREQQAQTDKGGKKVVFMSAILCILLSLAIILGAGFGTGTFGGNQNGAVAQEDSIVGEDSEGYQPNTVPGDQPSEGGDEGEDFQGQERPTNDNTNGSAPDTTRGQAMRDYLTSLSLAGSDAFANLASPESLALQWLVLEDPLQLDAGKEEDQFQISQRYALMTLWYNSDFTWANETNWLQGHECDWYGISCISLISPSQAGSSEVSKSANSAMQVVTRINLEGNNVQGKIPADLGLLTFVTSLNLADNVIEGTLPPSLTKMVSLEELLLDRNLMVEDLSTYDFSSLAPSLQLLDLSDNGFVGMLPASLFSLTSLELLVLDNNAFTGAISSSVGQLSKLTRFTVGGNQLSDTLPTALSSLPDLEVIWLFKNQLSGPLLAEWASSLIVLDVYDNQLTGNIPSQLTELPNLQQLVLGGNRFNGAIPDEFGQFMPQLTVLNIEACELEGPPIPDSFARLGNLTVLRVGNNPDMDSIEIPAFVFEEWRQLQELRLPGLGLTGDLNQQQWRNLRRLRVIDLSNNNFTNFPQDIGVCRNLEELNLSDNSNLGGNIPDSIDDLRNLKNLLVANSGLFGNITDSIGNLVSLEYLDVTNNTLVGTLPDLSGLSRVQELKMGTNFFDGEIPESIGQLGRLQVLDLSMNFLKGEIPRTVANLQSLVILKLGDNANERPFSGFSGTLPSTLSRLNNLARLEVYNNRFTGALPSEWGALNKLQLLDIEFNAISGTIPTEWGGMTSLQELYTSNTDLEGAVPDSVCVPTLQFFVVDCDVSCSCCSRCEGQQR